MTLNYFSETGEHLKQQNINCFPYFYNASNAFDIRFVLCLTLMCEMETAAVITLKGCEGKLCYQRSRY